jgi:uracil-DNA glycosylase
MDLDHLHEKIRVCQLCDLSLNRINAVAGEGPCPVEIMLVGEAPGREEDLTGRPFVGRAGRLLDAALTEAGLKRSEVFITSVIKCRPPDNRKPKRYEIEACHPYLETQMNMPDGKCSNTGRSGNTGRNISARPDLAGSLSSNLSSGCGLEKRESYD